MSEVHVPAARRPKPKYCSCTIGEESWSISGWHFCWLTPFLADRIAAARHPHDEQARKDYRDHLEQYISVVDIAYERCEPYMDARRRRAQQQSTTFENSVRTMQ